MTPSIRTSDRPIFFHIPKTAGQTLNNLLDRHYRGQCVFCTDLQLMSEEAWSRVIERVKAPGFNRDWVAYKGHMKFGLHEYIGEDARYVTFVREPVARCISYYCMLERMGLVRSPLKSLEGFDWITQHSSLAREFDNGQTRALANAPLDLPFGHCSDLHLDQAIANMDRYFAFVGLTERFNLSLLILNKLHGWKWRFYASKNRGQTLSAHQSLSLRMREAIRQLNRHDEVLYQYIVQKFQVHVRSYGRQLQLETAAFSSLNVIHESLHHLRHAMKKKASRQRARAEAC